MLRWVLSINQIQKGRINMGILSTLLNVGTFLGKICQSINGGSASIVQTGSGDCIVQAGNAEINGVRFVEVEQGGVSTLSALNLDPDLYACVTYPNGYGKTAGEQVFIPPLQTVSLNLDGWDNSSVDMPFYVQKINLQEGAASENNRIVIAFKQLPLDGTPLQLTNTKLTFAKDTLNVFFPTAGLGDLITADLTSQNGVHATLREPVSASQAEKATTEYEIDISSLGFDKDDVISGMFQFGISTAEAQKLKLAADKNAEKYTEISSCMCRLLGVEQ